MSETTDLALQHEQQGRIRESLALLQAGASSGDARAEYLLGVRLLQGQAVARDIPRSLRLIGSAAKKGDADALHLSGVLSAVGIAGAPDWRAAMARLRKAADRGHASAKGQLAALEPKFNVQQWLNPPPPRMQFESPRVGVIEGFLPAAMCAWLIEWARPRLRRATVTNAATGQNESAERRSNSGVHIPLLDSDLIVHLLKARVASVLGVPAHHHEHPNILHYEPGQTFDDHFDFLDPRQPGFAGELAMVGQRVATFLVYLNDNFDGGDTEFPTLEWRFKGRTGDALFFWNVDAGGNVEHKLLHAGRPPTQGEKWLFSQWVREKPVPLI